ncbi:MAG: hypothetical protein DMG63_01490, partial [Acidobacteria bacterium]
FLLEDNGRTWPAFLPAGAISQITGTDVPRVLPNEWGLALTGFPWLGLRRTAGGRNNQQAEEYRTANGYPAHGCLTADSLDRQST